jgi:ubiquitin-protein ligase
MKRFWQHASPHEMQTRTCTRTPETLDVPCLKRVRLSTSPGELRLERDLHDLATMSMHWTRVSNRRWESKHGVVLERRQDPMSFVLHFDQSTQIWMQVSRSYPHEPPIVTHVQHPHVLHVIVTLEPASTMHSMMIIQSDTTLVYDNWSPVRQLSDLLDYLTETLSLSPRLSHHRDISTPTLLSDQDMQEPPPNPILNLQKELSPNRFDMGYPKPNKWGKSG